MERRADVLDEVFGVASYLDIPFTDLEAHGMANRWCLMVDELAVFSSLRGVVPPAEKPPGHQGPWRPLDPYQVAMTDLAAITAMDRAMGMSSVVATQHPIAEHLGPFGSTLEVEPWGPGRDRVPRTRRRRRLVRQIQRWPGL